MSEELKPCPWNIGTNDHGLSVSWSTGPGGYPIKFVRCECGIRGPEVISEDDSEAIAAWNRRTPSETVSREAVTRDELFTVLGAGVMAHKPELREQDGRYELDFSPTIGPMATDLMRFLESKSLPAPRPVSTGEEILHLVRFLANYQAQLCKIRANVIRQLHLGQTAEAEDELVLHWPIIQGLTNQMDLGQIGKQPFDMGMMRPAIKAMLDGSAPRTPVPSVVGVPIVEELVAIGRKSIAMATGEGFSPDEETTIWQVMHDIRAHLLTRQPDIGAVVECSWVEDDDGNFDTSCGEKHAFISGCPVENGTKFCLYCGKKLAALDAGGVR